MVHAILFIYAYGKLESLLDIFTINATVNRCNFKQYRVKGIASHCENLRKLRHFCPPGVSERYVNNPSSETLTWTLFQIPPTLESTK